MITARPDPFPDFFRRSDAVLEEIGLPRTEASDLTAFENGPFGNVLIKNESDRLGLGAFKAIGDFYAVARLLADRRATATTLVESPRLVTASAGNHGISVATGARFYGLDCHIHLPRTTPDRFIDRITAFCATVDTTAPTYELAVSRAKAEGKASGNLYLSDTADTVNEVGPRYVMEGYTRIADELKATFETDGGWPTHVYLHAGVGGLAAAVAWSIRHTWRVQPDIVIVEADRAPCLAESARLKKAVTVTGAESVMHRLDCKAPSAIAFHLLSRLDVSYIQISDDEAIRAAHTLEGMGYTTTPSGAAGYGGYLKAEPEPPGKSRALTLVTELAQPHPKTSERIRP